MICNNCSFETPRLIAREWHSPISPPWRPHDLTDCLPALLSAAVTASLPTEWQGTYSPERTRDWIAARDLETTNLLVLDRLTGNAVGLVFLFEGELEGNSGTEVRLGYLIAESAWGQGYASELVRGVVDWCRHHPVVSIVGGMDQNNRVSARVLEKNGFQDVTAADGPAGERFFRLSLIA